METKYYVEHNFSVKKGSLTNINFTVYDDYAQGTKKDLSAYDNVEMLVYDKKGGSSLFNVTGTINQGTSNISLDITKANTASLTNDTGYHTIKFSNGDDDTLDWIPMLGVIEFLD